MSDSRNPIPNPEPLPTPNPPAAPVPPAGPYVQAAPNAPVNPPPSGAMGDPYSPPMFQYAPVPPKRKEPVDGKDSVFALVFFLFSMLWADFALLHGFRLGFTIATALFFVLMTAYLAVKGVRLRLYPLCCGLMAVAGSIPFAIYHDTLIELVSFAAIILLLALYGAQLSGCCRYSPGGFRCIADVANSVLIYPVQFMGVSLRSLFSKTPPPESSDDSAEKPKKPTRKILLGVLCAVPVLAVIIPLLIRSDLYFEQLLSHFSLNIKDLVIRLLLGVLLFPFLFSLLFAWKKKLPLSESSPVSSAPKGADPVAIQSFLSALSVVYLVYLMTQTAYFFSAFRGLLPQGFEEGVTEYARRGFFEMCAIAAINLAILFLTMVLVRKEEGRIPRFTQILGTFLCLFTILLIGTALSKMFLYIDYYGMTRLRIITSCFMVFLVLVFLAVGIRLWKRKFPYMKMVVLAFCAVGLTVSFCDIDATIARYNVSAYHSGKLERMDVDNLANLSDSTVPYLLELQDDPDPVVSARIHNELATKLFAHFEVECPCQQTGCRHEGLSYYLWTVEENGTIKPNDTRPGGLQAIELRPIRNEEDIRGYNVSRKKAGELLQQNAERILSATP